MTLNLSRKAIVSVSSGKQVSERIDTLMTPPPAEEMWCVRRLLMSRPKQSKSTELVQRVAQKFYLEAADPELEWYIQVSVYSGNVVAFIGELTVPADGENNPQDELDKLVQAAHKRATFLNTNCIELPGPPVVESYR